MALAVSAGNIGAVTTGDIQATTLTPDKLGSVCGDGRIPVRAADRRQCGTRP
jgi:hypothetical protein